MGRASTGTWDSLAEYLEKQSSGKEVFVINRSFDVELKTLFETWTQPNQVMSWTPPVGYTGKYLSADIRPGGESFYVMNGNGISMYWKAKYLELTHLSRLVYTQTFADQNGNTSRHPMAPTWPEVLKTTVSFYEEGPKKSRITLQWEVYGEANQEALNFGITGVPFFVFNRKYAISGAEPVAALKKAFENLKSDQTPISN